MNRRQTQAFDSSLPSPEPSCRGSRHCSRLTRIPPKMSIRKRSNGSRRGGRGWTTLRRSAVGSCTTSWLTRRGHGPGGHRSYAFPTPFAAMPTGRAALRAALIAQWHSEVPRPPRPKRTKGPTPVPRPITVSDNDIVFQQASYMLWNPLVSPALRSALYKLLADVPGVTVSSSAHSDGQRAVEISRMDNSGLPGGMSDGITYATYENPRTGAVLESTITYPPGSDIVTPQDPHGNRTITETTVYLMVTWASAVPADPSGG